MSIYALFRDRDYSALAAAVHRRWGLNALEGELACLHRLAFDRNPPLAGGPRDQPWSDESWLLWLCNRLEELSHRSCSELLTKAGIEPSHAIVDAPSVAGRVLVTGGTFEGFEAEVGVVDEAAELATIHVEVGFSRAEVKVSLSSVRRLPSSG